MTDVLENHLDHLTRMFLHDFGTAVCVCVSVLVLRPCCSATCGSEIRACCARSLEYWPTVREGLTLLTPPMYTHVSVCTAGEGGAPCEIKSASF